MNIIEELEMTAMMHADNGETEYGKLYMRAAGEIRQLRRALSELNTRAHSGYDWNADPENMTLLVGNAINSPFFESDVPNDRNERRADDATSLGK